jgi:hypothetical protein
MADETRRHAVTIAVEVQAEIFVNQSVNGVAVVGSDCRQWSKRIRLEPFFRQLTCFAMSTTIGDVTEPLMRLAIHIGKTGKATQRPEVLPDISDRPFDLPVLPM